MLEDQEQKSVAQRQVFQSALQRFGDAVVASDSSRRVLL
jgi:hypothetical protein